MNAVSAPSQRHPVEQLAEDFVNRIRSGERPSLSEYIRQYPDESAELADIIQALLMLEDLGAPDESSSFVKAPEQLGEYRIIREIGRGGMGVVYEAEQADLGRRVALKVLPAAALLRPTHLERFRREARAAARLHHTNIVPIFGVGVQDGIHYYAMQNIDGRSLDAVLAEIGNRKATASDTAKALATSLSGSGSAGSTEHYQAVARIGSQVADALAHAHEHGVLHRDVKPSNVILDEHGDAWLGDFGLAQLEGDAPLTSTGGFVGTLRYLAPERFHGDGDARSDVYSLGATLYELLTLRPMFDEKDRHQLIRRVTQETATAPRKVDAKIPKDLETIILKAVAREPADRYQKAADVVEDLQRFLGDRPVTARRVSRWEQCRRWVRRNPVVTALTVAVFLSLCAGLAATWSQWRRAEGHLIDKDRALSAANLYAKEAGEQSEAAKANRHRAYQMLDEVLSSLNTMTDRRPIGEARRQIMENAIKVNQEFIDSNPIDLQERLDTAKLAIQVAIARRQMQHFNEALDSVNKAVELCDMEPASAEDKFALLDVEAYGLHMKASIVRSLGRTDECRPLINKSVRLFQRLYEADPSQPRYARRLADVLVSAAVLDSDIADHHEAINKVRRAIDINRQLAVSNPNDWPIQTADIRHHRTLAMLYERAFQLADARATAGAALAAVEKLLIINPRSQLALELQVTCSQTLGHVTVAMAQELESADADKARELCRAVAEPVRKGVVVAQRLTESYRNEPEYRHLLATILATRATIMAMLGQGSDAIPIVEKAIAEEKEAVRLAPRNGNYLRGQVEIYRTLGLVYCELGQYAKAAELVPTISQIKFSFRGVKNQESVAIAELLCHCAIAARRDANVSDSERKQSEERYLRQAMDILQDAVKRGFNNSTAVNTAHLLLPLRGRPDFQQLLAQLNAAAKSEPSDID